METHNTWFQISNSGWRRINAGRPLGQLVREAISNVFDAPGVTKCDIIVASGRVEITDDAPDGIKDRDLVTTVFLTDKEDSHLMRGRKGRGLKELVAAGTNARIATKGYVVDFNSDGTRTIPDEGGTDVGTEVVVYNEEWCGPVLQECVEYLRRFITPIGITMKINGVRYINPAIKTTIADANLQTTIIKDGKQVEVDKPCTVTTLNLRPGEKKGWVYEMGIPVQEVDTPFHINVEQRIPMNDNRDVVDAKYLPKLYAIVMRQLLDTTDREELTEHWMLRGVEAADWSLQAAFVRKLVPEGYAIKSEDKLANDKARQHGIKLIDISMLPGDARWTIGYHGKDTVKVMKELEKSAPIKDRGELRQKYQTFVKVMEYLAEKLIDKKIEVTFMAKMPSYNGHFTVADYTAATRVMRWNMDIEHTYFDQPIHPNNLTTLIHELAHDKVSEHDDLFIDEVQSLGGKLAILCLTYQQTLYKMVKEGSSVAKEAPTDHHSPKTTVLVTCEWPDCGKIRMVKPQDVFQTKYCVTHQAEHTKERARRRRLEKKLSP